MQPQAERPPSTIIMVDRDGNLTDDPALAVSGEVVEQLPDGTSRYTTFVNRSANEATEGAEAP